jgi:hypothetical protein
MMTSWLHQIALAAKARTGWSPELVAWFLIAVGSLAAALGFLCLAAFVWVADRYDPVSAGLILGGALLLIAVMAAIACLIARRRNIERARLELVAHSQSNWLNPQLLATGIELGRTLGWRRLTAFAAVGLLAVGLGQEWRGRSDRVLRAVPSRKV